MSERRDVMALLREGVDEARLGNREAARALLEKVVALDPQNEKGWLWLASVAETEQDQRAYLQRVLALNPNNESAQRALARIEARAQEFDTSDEVVAGVSRRQFRTLLIAGVAVLLVAVLIIVAVFVSNNRAAAPDPAATELANLEATSTAVQVALLSAAATETQAALEEPTPTPTATVLARTPVPTWTPTVSPTPLNAVVALPTPAGLQGIIAGWSGRDLQNIGYLPVGGFDLANGAFTPAGSSVGRDVRLQPNSQRIIYTRYDQVLFGTLIEALNLNGSQPESVNERWQSTSRVLDAQMPDFSRDGSRVAFIGVEQGSEARQLFMVNMASTAANANQVRRLTNDNATYSYPAFSPDGSRIAVVKNDERGPAPGADIVIIDIETLTQTSLTTDLGTFIETSPRWSPDGQQIVYAAAPATDPNNSDIAIRASAGFGLPTLPVRDPANDIYPVFSPDGRMLAFASNRGGQYDIYIYDIGAQTLSQLTNTPQEDYPGGWWQPGQ